MMNQVVSLQRLQTTQKKMSKFCVFLVLIFGFIHSSYSISVERKIFPDQNKKGQSFIVSITIKKEGEEGFAKLMETIPDDFKAEELNSATGNFICEDGKLRIIWLTMPDGDSFRAEYKLIYQGVSAAGSFNLGGKFYYVKGGKRSELNLTDSSLKISEKSKPKEEVVVPKITTKSIDTEEIDSAKTVISEPQKDNISEEDSKPEEITPNAIEEPIEAKSSEDTDILSNTETLKSEVVFKVQLGVFSIQKELAIFGNLPEVHFIKVGNLYKYYAGKFASEYEARSTIEQAKASGFSGAFLVRFKDGQRL